jgi:hypothetical protein
MESPILQEILKLCKDNYNRQQLIIDDINNIKSILINNKSHTDNDLKFIDRESLPSNITFHYIPNCTFDNWIKNITIDINSLHDVFDHTLTFAFHNLLTKYIDNIDNNNIPIKTVGEKKKKLYIYNGEWKSMSKENIESFVSYLQQLYIDEFNKWSNIENNLNDPNYLNYIDKIINMTVSFKTNLYNKSKRVFYKLF